MASDGVKEELVFLFFLVPQHTHTPAPWQKQCHPQTRRRPSPAKQKVSGMPLFFLDKSTIRRFSCCFVYFLFRCFRRDTSSGDVYFDVVVAKHNPATF
jgi:hypothetical protein